VEKVKPGDEVQDFELPDQDGTLRSLGGLLEAGPVVLFFYPAAMTVGCTKESCYFRDRTAEFEQLGAQPVGISTDDVDTQREFADRHGFGYPLLSDVDGKVAKQFGVKRHLGLLPVKRATFVIGTDRRVTEVIASEFNMHTHADRALAALRG
jgi:peroxiredoxin Q/BCP